MSTQWNWLDEFARMAESYKQKPPTITELLDTLEKFMPADSTRGWADITDSPRAETPPPTQEASVPRTPSMTDRVTLYKCPACQAVVQGTTTMQPTDDQPDAPMNDTGIINVQMKVVGIRVDPHDCTPKAPRPRRSA